MNSIADNGRDDLKLIEIDQAQLRQHVDGLVKDAVEDTLNAMLDAEAEVHQMRMVSILDCPPHSL